MSEFSQAAPHLRQLRPEVGLFTGGGMIDAETINVFSHGIINVHMGHLPQYKGMDVVQAPILEGRRTVGATAHLMVPKLDAGPVLEKCTIDVESYSSLGALRNTVSCALPFLLIDSALDLVSGRSRAVDQPPSGRQYFITHPRLATVVNELMSARGNSATEPEPLKAIITEILADLR